MKKLLIILIIPVMALTQQCTQHRDESLPDKTNINERVILRAIDSLVNKYGPSNTALIEKGVTQAASLWYAKDGSPDDFVNFCIDNYYGNDSLREQVFKRISGNFESILGNMNRITINLMEPLHLNMGELLPVDETFGNYSVSAHLTDDFFENKLAFTIILNFPAYTLAEKNEAGPSWTRLQWAYARLGDMFISRVPAKIQQSIGETVTKADLYISDYNIYMGNLVDEHGSALFPKDMKLITHWGLRDELKSCYNSGEGLKKQKLIYEVMKKIILQEIPDTVINNPDFTWNPYSNKIFNNGKEIISKPESDTRYTHLLNIFKANREADSYNPLYPTYILRNFDGNMEIPQQQVEQLFIDFISSPQVKEVAALISKRLGRNLEPFDIWYDGFKARNTVPEEELTEITRVKYPNGDKLQDDLPFLLQKLGFEVNESNEICSRITVDPSRGAGHAWGSEMRGDKSHLRTRIGLQGMDYKGYNIAVHEFGHNVEQTLSLYNIDHYFLKGVPSTAFTEALAFIFQKRDLELLGIKNNDQLKNSLMALDNFWASYEIMGVSLVDMEVWKWLYAHPDASPAQLKEQVVTIAKDIWNKYYSEVFGSRDEPILAIYSHMIDAPLYLSAYPVGHIIDFQLEKHLKDKSFPDEIKRVYTTGRIIPDLWMKNAVGAGLSVKPLLEETSEALKKVNE